MKNKEKVLALYNYISEISKNLKNTKTNINEEKWLEFFRNFPKHKNIIFEYEKLDEKYFENEESKLLEIKRPDFTKPLHIDKALLSWIEGDWGDYRAVIEINEKTFIGDEESGSGEIADITPEIEAELQKELEKREQWVEEQLIIEEVRNFFDTLYIKYLELNKETETLELMIGNGIVRIKERNIYYPVLLKKIKIDFNAKDNILILSDLHSNESFSPFLYTNFLNEINDIHLENIFELEKEIKERYKDISVFKDIGAELVFNFYCENHIFRSRIFDLFSHRYKKYGMINSLEMEFIKELEQLMSIKAKELKKGIEWNSFNNFQHYLKIIIEETDAIRTLK